MAESQISHTKRALIVLSHPEPRSLNSQLAQLTHQTLIAQGYDVEISDLYRSKFQPAESPDHFRRRQDRTWFKVANEQKHAHETSSTHPDVLAAIAKLDRADLLVLQFPMWWYMPPAMLKGWLDRVLTYGAVYSSKQRFDTGRFKGKRVLLSITAGSTQSSYQADGRNGDMSLLLWPIQFSLHYVGYAVTQPYIAYLPEETEAEVSAGLSGLVNHLNLLDQLPCVPFNQPADWGEDDRLKPDALSHSLLSRHCP